MTKTAEPKTAATATKPYVFVNDVLLDRFDGVEQEMTFEALAALAKVKGAKSVTRLSMPKGGPETAEMKPGESIRIQSGTKYRVA